MRNSMTFNTAKHITHITHSLMGYDLNTHIRKYIFKIWFDDATVYRMSLTTHLRIDSVDFELIGDDEYLIIVEVE